MRLCLRSTSIPCGPRFPSAFSIHDLYSQTVLQKETRIRPTYTTFALHLPRLPLSLSLYLRRRCENSGPHYRLSVFFESSPNRFCFNTQSLLILQLMLCQLQVYSSTIHGSENQSENQLLLCLALMPNCIFCLTKKFAG